MFAKRKSDGKVIEVTEKPSWNKEKIYTADGIFYRKEDLDFNVEEAEEVTIDGWVARYKDGKIYAFWYEPIGGDDGMITSFTMLPTTSFPSLTWESGPLKVTVTVKPKKI